MAHAGGGVKPQRLKVVRLQEVRESQGCIPVKRGHKQGHAIPKGLVARI